jgi:uncharacterized protein (TIGR04255 family)
VQYESLGHMPRAPLAYSLAMIEYAMVPRIADQADAIMERLRGDYPDIKEFNVSSLNVDIDAATGESKASQNIVPQWRMNSPDSSFGLVFGSDRLVIHTTSYKHFDGFAEKIRDIASVIFEVANIKYIKSIGIRQIDNICPIDGMDLASLVKPGYLCPEQNEGLSPLNSRVEFIYRSNYGRLYVRAYQLSNHPRVPQDLFPVASELAPDLMSPATEVFVLADTDHIYTPSKLEKFDLTNIISILGSLHEQCSLGFRKMVTDEAIKAWRKEAE